MAILIKEMAMPNGCLDCYFADFDHTDVLVCDFNPGNDIEDVHTRPSWCPLVEIPKRPRYDAALLRDCGMEE